MTEIGQRRRVIESSLKIGWNHSQLNKAQMNHKSGEGME